MSEEALETGGHSALKAVEEAGFSAELKAQLEQRIAAANLRSSEADLPAAASRHTRDLATAEAWTGTESIHDASLRMLNDAYKPMRLGRPPKAPGVQPPQSVDTGHKRGREGRGLRLANARDRSTFYASVKDDAGMEAADRKKRLQEMKDRFDPHARVIVPGTIQGLASLANKRIEDAIARGQFKNVPRGKGKNVDRDHNASSPFIDTTEYFMNKIIQKQEIVPPWIEKQQELTLAANKFRSRLRNDWKRHAARMISSKGGSLQDQIRRAEAYAKAELIANPLRKKQETLTAVDDEGHLSQISLSGGLKINSSQEALSGTDATITEEITAERTILHNKTPHNIDPSPLEAAMAEPSTQTIEVPISTPAPTVPPAPHPFRDLDWERIEFTYQTLAIKDLNDKARSYNLQAPELAKRPYYNLQRELNSCFADVAPQLAEAILDRARRPPKRMHEGLGVVSGEKRVWDGLVGGPVRVRDERREKQYGFRQFWKDLWADKSSSPY
ncbi:Nn.00g045710.m01.CDS01 [Neocucurbitaria sp. VM-36]